jgi:hypothetical protein
MRATHDQPVTTLFGGERIAFGCRGRRSGSHLNKRMGRRLAVVFGALLIGCASAATAYTVRQSTMPERNIAAGANFTAPASSYLASALW